MAGDGKTQKDCDDIADEKSKVTLESASDERGRDEELVEFLPFNELARRERRIHWFRTPRIQLHNACFPHRSLASIAVDAMLHCRRY
ncbi:hypothetical protein [Novosphingobium sp. PY1]|uniref:hypothetical protein n=1 Tax=Novosphingobium sp. PY1 TaxID=1882221 RepID=UPI001AA28396|nr:hypothetical protein [Novosphingobium sp. PY1]GFM30364.1 25S rRNA adenine-N(1) methyltransferase [Novosphingobium sp. PY1]